MKKSKVDPLFRNLFETANGTQTINPYEIGTSAEGKPELVPNKQILAANGKPVLVAMNRAARRAAKSRTFLKRNGYETPN